MMPQDRRLSLRKTPRHLGYLSLPPDNGGFVLDVSEGGIGFQTIAPLKAKGPIQFRFAIDSPTRIRAVGEVAWIDETGKAGGLRFTQLPEGIRERIRDWAAQSKDAVLDLQIVEALPAKKPEAPASAEEKPMLALVAAPETRESEPNLPASSEINSPAQAEPDPPAAADLPPVALEMNPPLPTSKAPIFTGRASKFTMFPVDLDADSETTVFAVPQSNTARHPVAAIALTIILALLVSVPLFVFVTSSRAGDALFDWSQRVRGATNPQAFPQDPPVQASPAPDAANTPQP